MITMIKKVTYLGLITVMVMSLFSCVKKENPADYYKYQGFIQGTTFSVIYQYEDDIAVEIDSLLNTFNKSLNNYDSTSLISQINRNESFQTDSLFEEMFVVAQEVWQKSGERFDISIAPLANAWGFGYKTGAFPDSAMVDSLLDFIGLDRVQLKNHQLIKADDRIQIIGNALAQGLSVDYLSENLRQKGIDNFLVEIGGEVYAQGLNVYGETWQVGIDKPEQDSMAMHGESMVKLSLSEKAVATSGNYRKFHIHNGQAVGHALNPKTGYSEMTDVLSATVIHKKCVCADAWATAFMLMDSEQALQIAETIDDLELMIITGNSQADKQFEIHVTSGFPETNPVE